MNERNALREAIADLIRGSGDRDALFERIGAYQRAHVPAYARLARARNQPTPAMPTDVFRFTRVASHPPAEDLRSFRTSGTTSGARGVHAFCDLSLYELAARTAAKRMLFPDRAHMRLVILLGPEDEVPDSSLSYMVARFVEWFADSHVYAWPPSAEALERALDTREPVALLGTSFAFVHAEDTLGRRFELSEGSRIMQTGGFKGKSRTLEADDMRRMLSERYGVPDPFIVSEYGMTELSSQMYETTLAEALAGETPQRRYWTPPWVRTRVVDPHSLEPLEDDEGSRGPVGILRIDDAANLDSVAFLQTADRAQRVGDGFVLLGRDPNAVPRGCSLAAEEALES